MLSALRRVVVTVALLNLAYFGIEFSVAQHIHSVSLFADSIDFLEDASVNLLIALAVGWTSVRRARLGMVLAGVLMIPGLATLWTAWQKLHLPAPPMPQPLALAASGALIVNFTCALLLARVRSSAGSLSRAAFLASRNDVVANLAILLVAWITARTRSGWPDLILGLAIAALNADSAREVWQAAREEHTDATSSNLQ